MQIYALFRDDAFAETRRLATQPEDIPHKRIVWYPVGTSIEGTPAGWSVVDGEAIQTVEPPQPTPRRTNGTFREFMDLFTVGEQAAIAGAAMQNVQIKLWYDRAMGGDVPLDNADTIAGVGALLSASLITQAAHDAVLAADYNDGPTSRVDV